MPRSKHPKVSSASISSPMSSTSRIAATSARPAPRLPASMDFINHGHMLADIESRAGWLDMVSGEIDVRVTEFFNWASPCPTFCVAALFGTGALATTGHPAALG